MVRTRGTPRAEASGRAPMLETVAQFPILVVLVIFGKQLIGGIMTGVVKG